MIAPTYVTPDREPLPLVEVLRPTLIGIGCTQRVGKDAIGAYLVERHGFVRVAFADFVRDLAREADPAVIGGIGLNLLVEGSGWESAKAVPEVRQFLINLGVGARKVLGDDVWMEAGRRKIQELLDDGRSVVVTDVRFPNEADMISFLGGELWDVKRPGSPEPDWKSEPLGVGADSQSPWWDVQVNNTGTLEDLYRMVDQLVVGPVVMRQHTLDPEIIDTVDLMGAAEPEALPWELTVEVQEAVEALPDHLREVIEALFYERVGQRNLATRLGVSRSTVCRRQTAALKALREALDV